MAVCGAVASTNGNVASKWSVQLFTEANDQLAFS